MDVTFKSLIGSHKLHLDEDDEDDQFDITRQRTHAEGIQQARSVGVNSEDHQKIDGMRSRNHLQGGQYYTTSTKIPAEQPVVHHEYSKQHQ